MTSKALTRLLHGSLRCLLILAAAALVATPVLAQLDDDIDTRPDIINPNEPSPKEEAEAFEEDTGAAVDAADGSVGLSLDTIGVWCAGGGVIVNPLHLDVVQEQLKASDNGDGTWTIPDAEVGKEYTAEVVEATFNFEEEGQENAEFLRTEAGLKIVPLARVARWPFIFNRCIRIRFHHRCGVRGVCPLEGACFGGHQITRRRNFLRCAFSPGSICLERLFPVCTLTRYTCRDCTGPVRFRRPFNQWVCAVF